MTRKTIQQSELDLFSNRIIKEEQWYAYIDSKDEYGEMIKEARCMRWFGHMPVLGESDFNLFNWRQMTVEQKEKNNAWFLVIMMHNIAGFNFGIV